MVEKGARARSDRVSADNKIEEANSVEDKERKALSGVII